MDIVESKTKHGHTLKINRSLDRTNCGDLEKALDLLTGKWDGAIWLDVSELQAVDSAGLTLFLRWHRSCLNANRRFGLVGTTPFHRKLLEITRLDEELMICDEPGGVRISLSRPGPWKGPDEPSVNEVP
ncbi:MAG: STAS domain-containing protein [Myxococcota bacterium]|nr:STAS domain-containing protein [Myxococcota bacterium]